VLKFASQVKCWSCGASQYIYATFCLQLPRGTQPARGAADFCSDKTPEHLLNRIDALPPVRAPRQPASIVLPAQPTAPSRLVHTRHLFTSARSHSGRSRLHPELINSVCINSPGGARANRASCWRFGVSSKQSARAS
jgi:hypothetical protein